MWSEGVIRTAIVGDPRSSFVSLDHTRCRIKNLAGGPTHDGGAESGYKKGGRGGVRASALN